MRRAAKGRALWPALLAAAAALLAGTAQASIPGNASHAELLAKPALTAALAGADRAEQPRAWAQELVGSGIATLAVGLEDRGFRVLDEPARYRLTSELAASPASPENQLGAEKPCFDVQLSAHLAPPVWPRLEVEAENLASGVKIWEPEVNIGLLRYLASISRQRAPFDHRARFYDPTTQTFLEPDPIGPLDSPNLYQAFSLDSFNVTDPFGESWWTAAHGYVAGVVEEADPTGLLPEAEAVDAGARAGSRDAEDFDVGKQVGQWTLRAATIAKAGVQQAVKVGWKEASKALARSEIKAQLQGAVASVTARLSGEAAEEVARRLGASDETVGLVGGLTREATARAATSAASKVASRTRATKASGQGVVYRRRNPKTGEEYVGQTKSPERFDARQKEHNRDLGVEHEYEVLGHAEPGKALDVLEETKLRENGGLAKEGGTLVNRRHQMREERYRQHGGATDDPNR